MASYLTFLRLNAPWLFAGFAISLLSNFGQTSFISVFAGDIIARFDLTEGSWGALYALATTLSAIVMLWGGALADRIALDRLTSIVLIGLALSCAAMTLAPGPLIAIPIVLGLRFFGQGMLSHIAYVAMARWFTRTRGQAVAIAVFGFAVGQASLPLLFTIALARVSFSTLWLVAAACCLAAILPLSRLLRRARTPQGTDDTTQEAVGLQNRHWTRAEVLRSPLFWGLFPALLGLPSFGTAFFFFQVHLPEVKGWSQVGFVSLFPLVMAVSTAMTFVTGALIDRVGASRLVAPALLPMALGFWGLSFAPTLATAIPAVAVMALTMGAMSAIPVSLWAEQFGTRHIGAIKAAAVAIMVLGSAVGPGLVGYVIDLGYDFPTQMPYISAYMLGSAALAHLVIRAAERRYGRPPQKGMSDA